MSKKRKKRVRAKRSWIVDVPIGVCVCLLVIGLLLGNVFVFVVWYEGRLVDQSETLPVTATFTSYTIRTSSKGSLNEVEIRFSDHEKLYIDGACFNLDVEAALDNLQGGDKVDLLLHPVSGDIWDMRSNGEIILSFDDAKDQMLFENVAFSVIFGGFGYFCVVISAVSLCLQWKERRKSKTCR